MFKKFFKWLEDKKYENQIIGGYGSAKLRVDPGVKNPFVEKTTKRKFGPPRERPIPKPRYKFDSNGLPIVKKTTPPKMKKPITEAEKLGVSEDYLKWISFKRKNQYILCSAIWIKDNSINDDQPKNITKGFVICGQRHGSCFPIIKKLGIDTGVIKCVCGFLTSDNRFVDRSKGAKIAFKAKQTEEHFVLLTSEDLF